jgi:hypothetical protein
MTHKSVLWQDSCELAVKKGGEEEIMASFKTGFQSLPKRTEDNHKNFH